MNTHSLLNTPAAVVEAWDEFFAAQHAADEARWAKAFPRLAARTVR